MGEKTNEAMMWLMTLLRHKKHRLFLPLLPPPQQSGFTAVKEKKILHFSSRGLPRRGQTENLTKALTGGTPESWGPPQGEQPCPPPPPPPPLIRELPLEWSLGKAVLVAQGGGGWFRWVEEKGISHPRCPPFLPLSPGQATCRHCQLSPAPNPLGKERDLWRGQQEVGIRGNRKKEHYFLNYPRPMSPAGRVALSLVRTPFYTHTDSHPDPSPISL